jgi:hypothetical protein
MVSVNVMLGASGAAGFTFGLVRTRVADHRGRRHPVSDAASGETPPASPGTGDAASAETTAGASGDD